MKNRWSFFLLVTAGALLAVTGFAKLWSALGTARALMTPDPLSGMPFKYVLAGVGVIEIVVATICFFGRSRLPSVWLVAWLSTNFLLYRIGLWWIGWKQPCGCMGSLTDSLHIKPETADTIAKVILAYLLIASYGLLLWERRQAARKRSAIIGENAGCIKKMTPCITRDLNVLLLLLLLVLPVMRIEAAALSGQATIEGTISYKIFGISGNVQIHQVDNFVLGVRQCKWYIKKTPVLFQKGGRNEKVFGVTEISSDATNFFQLTDLGAIEASPSQARLVGRVGSGSVPYNLSDGKMTVLWYAYASSCYLGEIGSSNEVYITPPLLFGSEEKYAKDFRVLAAWKSSTDMPGFTELIVFDGVPRYELSAAEVKARKWHFTNCVVTVVERMTTNGITAPAKIQAQVFSEPKPSHPSRLTATIEIITKAIAPSCNINSFVPALSGVADISDMRTISSGTPYGIAVLRATNWPRVEASRALATAILPAKNAKRNAASSLSWKRVTIVTCLASVCLAPLVILLKRQRRKSTMQV